MSIGPVVDVADRRLADAAVRFAAAGWAVFPYRGTSKRPRTAHGSRDATCDIATVERWWRWHPPDNIGVRIPTGYVVVDLDRHGDDPTRHCRWTPADLPETLVCVSGSGWHCWYACSFADELRSLSSRPGWAGVELKTHAVVVPPSVHASGKRYRWHRARVARLPGIVADAFRRQPRRADLPSAEPSDSYLRAARAGVREHLAAVAGPGNHHDPLVKACLRFRDLGLTDADAITDLLPSVPGHDEREALRTVRSVFR